MRHTYFSGLVLAAAISVVHSAAPAAPAEKSAVGPSDGLTTLFAAGAPWRCYVRLSPPMVAAASAKAAGIADDPAARTITKSKATNGGLVGVATPPPPENWTSADFDDSQWYAQCGIGSLQADPHGLPYMSELSPEYGQIHLRGRLLVNDPAGVTKLQLSVKYRGGVVVYLNGKQIARGHLGTGAFTPDTPGDDYPDGATFIERNGKPDLVSWTKDGKEKFDLRDRSLGPVDVPPGLLKKGVNLIAVELHRSDFPAFCQKNGVNWGPVGLIAIQLRGQAAEGSFVSPLFRPAGLKLWNVDIAQQFYDQNFPDPSVPLSPIKIVAARNGAFSGAVAVGSDAEIADLTATMSPLKADAAGVIPAGAVAIRYGRLDPRGQEFYGPAMGARQFGVRAHAFDGLLDNPPARVKLTGLEVVRPADYLTRLGLPAARKPGAVIPVWVTVNVPKDAAPGVYRGELTVTAKGAEPIRVPVELTVINWALPDVKDRLSLLNLYQSPDTLAMHYKVPMWSDKHWELIDRSVKLMAEAGNDAIFIPLFSKEQMGNEESMVYWIKDGEKYKYDFTVMDKYLDVFLKHHDKARLKTIVFIVYGNPCMPKKDGTLRDEPLLPTVTLLGADGAKSDLIIRTKFGTQECDDLLRPLLLALRERLKGRGLDQLMMLGMPGDGAVPVEIAAMFHNILPDIGWMRASHPTGAVVNYDAKDPKKTVPILVQEYVYQGPIPDPAKKRQFGWATPQMRVSFNRDGYGPLNLYGFAAPWSFRMWIEASLASGDRGAGRVGADFWNEDIRGVSNNSGTVYSRFLKSTKDQVGLGTTTTDLLVAGPVGAVTTIRLANACEGIEAAEALIFVEKALVEKKAAMAPELMEKAWKIIDERTNILRLHLVDLGSAGWQERDRKLYELAAEIAKQPVLQTAP